MQDKVIARLASDEISLGKNKKVYGRKNEKVEAIITADKMVFVTHTITKEKFYVLKSNLIV